MNDQIPSHGRNLNGRNSNMTLDLDQVSIDSDYPVSEITDVEYLKESPRRANLQWRMGGHHAYIINNGFSVIRHDAPRDNMRRERRTPMSNIVNRESWRTNDIEIDHCHQQQTQPDPEPKNHGLHEVALGEPEWSADESHDTYATIGLKDWILQKKNRPFICAFFLLLISLIVMCTGVVMSASNKTKSYQTNAVKKPSDYDSDQRFYGGSTYFPKSPTPENKEVTGSTNTPAPTQALANSPTKVIVQSTTNAPTSDPTKAQIQKTTLPPTKLPTMSPTIKLTNDPTLAPTSTPKVDGTTAIQQSFDKVHDSGSILSQIGSPEPPSAPSPGNGLSLHKKSYPETSFYVMAHTPKTSEDEEDLKQLLSSLPPDEDSFVVHLGDMMSSNSKNCTNERFQQMSTLFKDHSPIPILALPGNEDWPLCDSPSTALEYFHDNFVSIEQYWETNEFSVKRQTGDNVIDNNVNVNFAIHHLNILHIGINMADGDDTNTVERLSNNLNWINDNLTKFLNRARYIFIFGHSTVGNSVFISLKANLEQTYGKPVVYFEAHKDNFEVNKFVNSVILPDSWDLFWRVQFGKVQSTPSLLKVTVAGSDEPFNLPENNETYQLIGDSILLERKQSSGMSAL